METAVEHTLSKPHNHHKVLELNCFSHSGAGQFSVLFLAVEIFRLMSEQARIFLTRSPFWKGGDFRELYCYSFSFNDKLFYQF